MKSDFSGSDGDGTSLLSNSGQFFGIVGESKREGLWEKERMFGGWDKANPSRPTQLLHGFIRVWEFVYNLKNGLGQG